jgi:hypothetical protein
MIKNILTFLPFFYFQQTRLKRVKDWAFHGLYEWIPGIIILSVNLPLSTAILQFLIYYLAFISLYEIGYIANDQLAHGETEGRVRRRKLQTWEIILAVLVRVATFFAITSLIASDDLRDHWYVWNALLVVTFAIHNLLKPVALKCVTFCSLAFIRFFSPLCVMIDATLFQVLAVPIVLHYVLFRLITYMDSKNLLSGFDRKTNGFRFGYYLLMLPFSMLLYLIYNSSVPLIVTGYYLAVVAIFAAMLSVKTRVDPSR